MEITKEEKEEVLRKSFLCFDENNSQEQAVALQS